MCHIVSEVENGVLPVQLVAERKTVVPFAVMTHALVHLRKIVVWSKYGQGGGENVVSTVINL